MFNVLHGVHVDSLALWTVIGQHSKANQDQTDLPRTQSGVCFSLFFFLPR